MPSQPDAEALSLAAHRVGSFVATREGFIGEVVASAFNTIQGVDHRLFLSDLRLLVQAAHRSL